MALFWPRRFSESLLSFGAYEDESATKRGKQRIISVKGKGDMGTYFLMSRRAEAATPL